MKSLEVGPIERRKLMADRLVKRLEELALLKDGWKDGEGWAPTGEAVEAALTFAINFRDDGPSLFPTIYGGLLFEGTGFEIRISAEGDPHTEILD